MDKKLTLEEELKELESKPSRGLVGFHGPILITEDENYFKVKIHYHNKDLVKYIGGWQWNATEKKWLFKKNKKTFDELQKFKKYADEFAITEPTEKEYPPHNQFIEDEKIDLPDESSYHFDNDDIQENFSNNSRLYNIESQLEILNKNINDRILPSLDGIKSKPEIISYKKQTKDISENKNNREINYDDVIKDIISFYPDDEYNKLFKKYNFTIEQPADMVQNILNLIQCELMDLIPKEDYEKECLRVGEKFFIKNQINKPDRAYKLSLNDMNRFVKYKGYLHYEPNKPNPYKLIDTANNLRNKILKTADKEGLNKFLKTIYTLNFVILTRIAWEMITTRE